MKSIKFIITSFFVAIGLNCYGEVTVPVTPPDNGGKEEEIPGYSKRRTPPAPILCYIDMEAGTVIFSSSALDEIDSYQIYDASGEICLGCYDTPPEFTVALTNLSGDCCLKFLTPQGTYTAYINL